MAPRAFSRSTTAPTLGLRAPFAYSNPDLLGSAGDERKDASGVNNSDNRGSFQRAASQGLDENVVERLRHMRALVALMPFRDKDQTSTQFLTEQEHHNISETIPEVVSGDGFDMDEVFGGVGDLNSIPEVEEIDFDLLDPSTDTNEVIPILNGKDVNASPRPEDPYSATASTHRPFRMTQTAPGHVFDASRNEVARNQRSVHIHKLEKWQQVNFFPSVPPDF